MSVRDLSLSSDVTIPQLGFGVFQVDPATTQQVVETALAAGYRHIDTAHIYGNEAGVGAALRATSLPRDEVFVTTKVWNSDQGRDAALRAFDTSLDKLGLDVLDLYLIHWPTPARDLFVETWAALADLQAEGRVRAIGVSNFRTEDLRRLIDAGLPVPSINQIELHPALTQEPLKATHAELGIVTEAWSPLAQGAVLDDPAVTTIAAAHDATAAQVVLAWHLALDHVVIPKSVTPARIAENLAAAELTLTPDELAAISALDRGERIGPDPAVFNLA